MFKFVNESSQTPLCVGWFSTVPRLGSCTNTIFQRQGIPSSGNRLGPHCLACCLCEQEWCWFKRASKSAAGWILHLRRVQHRFSILPIRVAAILDCQQKGSPDIVHLKLHARSFWWIVLHEKSYKPQSRCWYERRRRVACHTQFSKTKREVRGSSFSIRRERQWFPNGRRGNSA